MAMITAIDVSIDQPRRKFLVMAGFVSEAGLWDQFDKRWRKRLSDDGLTYFHMQRFAQSSKPFDVGWKNDEKRRQALLRDLLDLIAAHTFRKFVCVVQTSEFEKLSESTRKRMGRTPLAIAGTFMAGMAKHWCLQERPRLQLPEFIFEDGDDGKGSLISAMENATGRTPIFRHKKDYLEKGIRAFSPLQASDILAFEIKKIVDEVGHVLPHDFRFRIPYQQLSRKPEEPRIFSHETTAITDKIAAVDQYFEENPLKS